MSVESIGIDPCGRLRPSLVTQATVDASNHVRDDFRAHDGKKGRMSLPIEGADRVGIDTSWPLKLSLGQRSFVWLAGVERATLMIMPATESPIMSGHAQLAVEMVSGQSTVTSASSSTPIKILVPKSRGTSAWAYTSSFGGGMVGGDQTHLDVHLGARTRCFIGTQASTKIYRNPRRAACSHVTRARLASGSLLIFAPDPIQAFAGSAYSQRQEFHLESGAGLVLLDWFNSGRAARGERWEFSRFSSRNDVFIDGERAFLDSILLDPSAGPLDSPMRAGRFNCFAALLVIGVSLRAAAHELLNNICARSIESKAPLLVSASPIRDGAVLRLAGEEVEAVGREIHQHLAFVRELLGDDPWARKW